jgi:hypothetical protein
MVRCVTARIHHPFGLLMSASARQHAILGRDGSDLRFARRFDPVETVKKVAPFRGVALLPYAI